MVGCAGDSHVHQSRGGEVHGGIQALERIVSQFAAKENIA